MSDDTTTQTMHQLLIVALQDLWHGRAVVRKRLGAIADATADPETRAELHDIRIAAAAGQGILSDLLPEEGDTPNLWAAGILDDACRDVATTAQGPVRDIALIGAIRKLLASDIVSLETALHLAERHGPRCTDPLEKLQSDACARDGNLLARLNALAKQDA